MILRDCVYLGLLSILCPSALTGQSKVCVEWIDRNMSLLPGQSIELLRIEPIVEPKRYILTGLHADLRPCVDLPKGVFKINVLRSAEVTGESYTYIDTVTAINANITLLPQLRAGTYCAVGGGGTLPDIKVETIELKIIDGGLPMICSFSSNVTKGNRLELTMRQDGARCSVGRDSIRAWEIIVDKEARTVTAEGSAVIHTVGQNVFKPEAIRGSSGRITFHITAHGLQKD